MFYRFDQNNSGGKFQNDDMVTLHVIVEADSVKQANTRAEEIGLYFDGVDRGLDCACCGDRWSRQWPDDDGFERPTLYGYDPQDYKEGFAAKGAPYCRVYYKDGSVKTYRVPRSRKPSGNS